MQGSSNAGAPYGQPPPKSQSSSGCIIAVVVGLVAFLVVAGIIGKYAVARYSELERQAAEKRRAAEDGDDSTSHPRQSADAPSDTSAPQKPPQEAPGEVKVDLGEEGSLSLPRGAKLMQPIPLQPNLSRAVAYELGSNRLLVITVTKPVDVPCSTLLDKNDKLAEVATKEPDFEKLFHSVRHERRHVGGTESIYTEMDSRSPKEAEQKGPFHHGLGYFFCGAHAGINLALMRKAGDLTQQDRSEMEQIVLSRSPANGKLLVADVPDGFARPAENAPDLDANGHAAIEKGDIVLWDSNHIGMLLAHATPAAAPATAEGCAALGDAAAKAAGGSVVSAKPVTLALGKVCQIDVQIASNHIARSLVWALNDHLTATVGCAPVDVGGPLSDACTRFAASVKAK
jgi:hypothetical protein